MARDRHENLDQPPSTVYLTTAKEGSILPKAFGLDELVSLAIIVGVFLTFTFAGFSVYTQWTKAAETHTALCIFKYDLIDRRDRTSDYLDEHKGELKILGVDRTVFENQLAAQTATIASLRVLDCPQDSP